MYDMPDSGDTRSARLAALFETAQNDFTRLVENLTDEQWRLIGKNHPKRMNDEDEGRSVGVIAHHVATSGDWIVNRIRLMLEGRPLPPADFREINAKDSAEHADVSREEVLRVLRESGPRLAATVRAIPDDQLDQSRDTPAGPMSIAQRVELVLIGHIQGHQGSIEASIAQS
jgi:DinB superfamily